MKIINYRHHHHFNASTSPSIRLPIYHRQNRRYHPYPRNVSPIHLDILKIRQFLEEDEIETYFSDIDPVELAAAQVRAALHRENQEQVEEDAERVERLSLYILDFVAGVRRALDELDNRTTIPPPQNATALVLATAPPSPPI